MPVFSQTIPPLPPRWVQPKPSSQADKDRLSPHIAGASCALLERALNDARRYKATLEAQRLLSNWRQLVFREKMLANKAVSSNTQYIRDAAKNCKQSPPEPDVSGLLQAFEWADLEEQMDQLCWHGDGEAPELQDGARSDDSEIIQRLKHLAFLLNTTARQVLQLYQSNMREFAASQVDKWREAVIAKKPIPQEAKTILADDAVVRAQMLRDAEPHAGWPWPSEALDDEFRVILLEELGLPDLQAYTRADRYVWVQDRLRLRAGLRERLKSLHEQWAKYDVTGPYAQRQQGARRGAGAKKKEKAQQGAVDKAKVLCDLDTGLERVLEAVSPLSNRAVRKQEKPISIKSQPFPEVQRLPASKNDQVLQLGCPLVEAPEPDREWWPSTSAHARPDGEHPKVLTRIKIERNAAQEYQMTFTVPPDTMKEQLQELGKAILVDSQLGQRLQPPNVTKKNDRLHPLFVLSRLRGTRLVGTDGAESFKVYEPHLYADTICEDESNIKHLVVAVVDEDQLDAYLWRFRDRSSNLLFISISSPAELPLRVGRKHQVIKSFASYQLGLHMYWVVDDDLDEFLRADQDRAAAPLHYGARPLLCSGWEK